MCVEMWLKVIGKAVGTCPEERIEKRRSEGDGGK